MLIHRLCMILNQHTPHLQMLSAWFSACIRRPRAISPWIVMFYSKFVIDLLFRVVVHTWMTCFKATDSRRIIAYLYSDDSTSCNSELLSIMRSTTSLIEGTHVVSFTIETIHTCNRFDITIIVVMSEMHVRIMCRCITTYPSRGPLSAHNSSCAYIVQFRVE